jgi:hypothetical protein
VVEPTPFAMEPGTPAAGGPAVPVRGNFRLCSTGATAQAACGTDLCRIVDHRWRLDLWQRMDESCASNYGAVIACGGMIEIFNV